MRTLVPRVLARAANAARTRLPKRVYLWLCDRLYHEAAFAYDAVAAQVSGGRWRAWGERAARGLRGRVVEVGPGPGHLLVSLRRRGIAAVGVELSPAMAGRAASHSPGAVARGDGRCLPLRTGSIDALLLTFPAPYVLDSAFWAEAARVVRPGGRLRILLEVGRDYRSRGASRMAPSHPDWRVRPAWVRAGDAVLGLLLARRKWPSAAEAGRAVELRPDVVGERDLG